MRSVDPWWRRRLPVKDALGWALLWPFVGFLSLVALFALGKILAFAAHAAGAVGLFRAPSLADSMESLFQAPLMIAFGFFPASLAFWALAGMVAGHVVETIAGRRWRRAVLLALLATIVVQSAVTVALFELAG